MHQSFAELCLCSIMHTHGRRSSKWFGETLNFFPKNDLMNFARKINWSLDFDWFSLRFNQFLRKKSLHRNWDYFFVQIKVISKKQKKVIVPLWTTFLWVLCWSPKKKKSRDQKNWPKNTKLPKILTRDRHLKTKWGAVAPRPPLLRHCAHPTQFSKAFICCRFDIKHTPLDAI